MCSCILTVIHKNHTFPKLQRVKHIITVTACGQAIYNRVNIQCMCTDASLLKSYTTRNIINILCVILVSHAGKIMEVIIIERVHIL